MRITAPSHITGSETLWTAYGDVHSHAEKILERIQAPDIDPSFMPEDGPALPQEEVDLIQARHDAGLPES